MSRREKDTEYRKNDIIDAAEILFFEKGFENTTVDDIAREAKYSKRTVYIFFTSKKEIYYRVLSRGYSLIYEIMVTEINSSNKKSTEKIKEIFEILYRFKSVNPNYFQCLLEYENFDYDNEENIILEIYNENPNMISFIQEIIKKGIEESDISNSVDIITSSIYIYGSIIGNLNLISKNAVTFLRKYNRTNIEMLVDSTNLLISSLLN